MRGQNFVFMELFFRSGNFVVIRDIQKGLKKAGNLKNNGYCSLQKMYLLC